MNSFLTELVVNPKDFGLRDRTCNKTWFDFKAHIAEKLSHFSSS